MYVCVRVRVMGRGEEEKRRGEERREEEKRGGEEMRRKNKEKEGVGEERRCRCKVRRA